jgi:O-antigen/teichoic acid export membrane protein
MATLRKNILSNYAGQAWMAVMGIVFLPAYTRILGMEAFGLVGLMLSIQSISQLFDFGIGGATNRELARRAHDPALADATRDMLRTSETMIWLLTLMVGLLIWLASGAMADRWLHLHAISRDDAAHAIAIMGLAIALLWPNTYYANCLSGLERQPALNVIAATFATLRSAGALAVLLWVSPTVVAFFWWYAAVGVGQSIVTAVAVWRALPQGQRRPRWAGYELRSSGRFAGGLFGVGILAMGVSQLDRLGLATLRPLAELGYYTLALSVAAGLGRMVLPMFNALYPRFSRLTVRHDDATLSELYHLSSQYLAVVVAAVAAVLIVYAHAVLLLWTGNPDLASQVALPLAILVAGSALNGLMNIPYALQLANGWTRLALGLNAVSLLIGIPFCLWAIPRYGMAGAACVWLFANLVSVTIGVPLMHRRLLQHEMAGWYLRDILPPVLAATVTALVLHLCLPTIQRTSAGFLLLGVACACTLATSALAQGRIRGMVYNAAIGLLTNTRHP